MRIVEIIPLIAAGGAERFVVDLANDLSKRHEVTLCVLYDVDPIYQYIRRTISPSVNVVVLGKRLGPDIRMPSRLYTLLRKLRPDVVHTHLQAFSYVSIWATLFRQIRFFHTVHNDAFKEAPFRLERKFRAFFFARQLFQPVSISNHSRKSFVEAYGMVPEQINNGRSLPLKSVECGSVEKEVDAYKPSANSSVYVHLGRVEAQKNPLMLVEAFKRFLAKTGSDAILLLLGGRRDESLAEELEAAVQTCPSIYYLGAKENATDYLYAADFFCLSSLHEGLPISLLEAMAVGAVPVCTPAGGICSVIRDGENGILAEGFSSEDYQNALDRSAGLPNTEALIAQAKADFHENYEMGACALHYEALFHRALRSS